MCAVLWTLGESDQAVKIYWVKVLEIDKTAVSEI